MMSKLFATHSFGSHKNRSSPVSPESTEKIECPASPRSLKLNYFRRHGDRISTGREPDPKQPPSLNNLALLFGPAATSSSVWRKRKMRPEDVLLAANSNGPLLSQVAAAMKEPALQVGLCFDSVLRAGILIIVTSPDGDVKLGKCDYEEHEGDHVA